MAPKFAKHDIVRDTSDESTFEGMQGEVIRVYPNGTLIVRFPLFMIPPYFYYRGDEVKPVSITYKGEEIDYLVLEDHWDEEALTVWRASQLWFYSYHSVYFIKKPFKEGSACMVAGCEEVAIKRGLINFVGSVYAVDMCPEHCAQWDERAVEAFPQIKKAEVTNDGE